jgi:hypothetical protein
MEIRIGGLPDGHRKLLCQSDGKKVCLVRYDEKVQVERLQEISGRAMDAGKRSFTIDASSEGASPDMSAYHLLRSLSLSLANSMFPDNFPECTETRFFRNAKARYSATYTSFVSDDNGANERRGRAVLRYYSSRDPDERELIFQESEAFERSKNPGLLPTLEKIEGAGLVITRPESNHYLSDGKTVFFGVHGLQLPKLVSYAKGIENPQTDSLISLIATIGLRMMCLNLLRNRMDPQIPESQRSEPHKMTQTFYRATFNEIYCMVLSLLSSKEERFVPPHRPDDLALGFGHWNAIAMATRPFSGSAEEAEGFQAGLETRIERILDERF